MWEAFWLLLEEDVIVGNANIIKQLTPFPVDRITDNSVTDFDLFLKIADHIVLYGASGYKWYRRELTDLLKNGIFEFFIRPEDVRKATMYQRINDLPQINKNLAPRERIVSIEQIGAQFTKCLFEGEITAACVAKAQTISDALLDCIAEDRRCIQVISGLGDHDHYTYVHSMRVASYSLAIAIQMGLSDVEKLRDIALGAILHDVGKKEVPITLLHKPGALTDDEWKQLKAHPELGHKALSDLLISAVSKEIVLHHHEKNDGSGYPHGIDKASLLVEVQIATLADVYDALTSSRSYQQKRTRYEGLDFIRHNMLGAKLSLEPFQALISCLVADK